jgi:hypothetical protein
MLSPDEHPGVFTFLVGIVIIVLVAVGLSMVMEKRFAFSSGGLRLEREVELLVEESAGLRERVDAATSELAIMDGPRARAVETLQGTRSETAVVVKRKDDLLTARDSLRDAVLTIEREFSDYRDKYRRESRARAVGEVLGTLTLQDGRSYLEASITKVTDVGLEIRHQHGFARIHAPDLGAVWQDRFQWDDEKRRARLKEEALARERMSASRPVVKSPMPKRALVSKIPAGPKLAVPAGVAPEKLAALRTLFSAWQAKVARLESERDEAVSSSARQTSVPGRLETWSARATRLRGEVSKARVELEAARSRLAEVAPRDPLLMMPPARSR